MPAMLDSFAVTAFERGLPDFTRIALVAAEPTADPIAEAHAAGVAEGEARMAERHAARLAKAEQMTESMLAEARADWVRSEGGRLAAAFADGLARIETAMMAEVEAVLVPIVADGLRRRALGAFAEALRTALDRPDRAGIAIAVSGPADLLAALAARLGDRSDAISLRPDDGVELTTTIDGTHLATTLHASLAMLHEPAP